MSILPKLLEYEDSSLKGIPLAPGHGIKYDPATTHLHPHHRYHRTKAGLYVFLRHHADGRIKNSHVGEGSSMRTIPSDDNQNSYLENNFSCESVERVFNPRDENGSICRSTIEHTSGLKITYATNG